MKIFHSLRRKRYILLTRRKLKHQIKQLSESNSLKLNIGSGNLTYDYWLNLNLPFFDLTRARLWSFFFKQATINNILMEHVLEHLTVQDVRLALSFAKTYLHKSGNIRIAVPDKNHPNPEYIEFVKPGGSGAGADDHRSFWNYSDFIKLAEDLDFKYDLREYYNEQGELVMSDMDTDDGEIVRTARKPQQGPLKDYSSLIIDLSI